MVGYQGDWAILFVGADELYTWVCVANVVGVTGGVLCHDLVLTVG